MYVQWLRCRDGRRRLFEADLVDPADVDGRVGWVPGRTTVHGRTVVAMAPIDRVSSGKADAARRVAVLHDCPVFTALYEQAMGGDGAVPGT